VREFSFLSPEALDQAQLSWTKAVPAAEAKGFQSESAALVVVDMQNDFLLPEGLLRVWGGPAVVPRINRLFNLFRSAARPIVFTRHIYERPEVDGGATARFWGADANSQLLREGTWHSDLYAALHRQPGDRVLSKRRYSGFYGTDLELLLRTEGVRQVVVTGVCSNICCEATAHDAFFRDFDVFFTLDGTGGTSEEAHLAALRSIAFAYGKVVTVDDIASRVVTASDPQAHMEITS
jgi:nicotinamidase-related amidase